MATAAPQTNVRPVNEELFLDQEVEPGSIFSQQLELQRQLM